MVFEVCYWLFLFWPHPQPHRCALHVLTSPTWHLTFNQFEMHWKVPTPSVSLLLLPDSNLRDLLRKRTIWRPFELGCKTSCKCENLKYSTEHQTLPVIYYSFRYSKEMLTNSLETHLRSYQKWFAIRCGPNPRMLDHQCTRYKTCRKKRKKYEPSNKSWTESHSKTFLENSENW